MPMGNEDRGPTRLVVSREPKGPVRAGDKGSVGDQALMDAIVVILICWAIVFGLTLSFRGTNV